MRVTAFVLGAFALTLSTSVLAKSKPDKPALVGTDADPVRCKRIPVTGSLAQVRKECKLTSQWRADADEARRVLTEQRNCGGEGNAC